MPYVPSLVQVRQERRKVIEKRQRSMVHKYISRRATRPTADVCHGDWLPSLTFHKHPATLFALEQSAPSRGTVSMPSRNGAWLQIMHIGAHCTRLLGAAIVTLRSTCFRGELQGERLPLAKARLDREGDRDLARAELLFALQHPLAASDLLSAAIAGTGFDPLSIPGDERDVCSFAPDCIEDGFLARPRFGDF